MMIYVLSRTMRLVLLSHDPRLWALEHQDASKRYHPVSIVSDEEAGFLADAMFDPIDPSALITTKD
jgi:hypothetical protein